MRDADGVAADGRSNLFVGRADELAVLDELLRSLPDRTATVLIAGDAGMGKSRLVGELRDRAEAAGARVATARTPFEGQALPYGAIAALVRDLGRQVGAAEVADAVEVVRRLLFEPPDERAAAGPLARLRLFDAMLRAVEALAVAGPTVLVLEDLHWADDGSIDLLDHLVRNLEHERVLVAATHRTEEMERRAKARQVLAELRRLPTVASIELAGLSRDEVGLLLRSVTGEDASWALLDAIHRRSEGNPLFAEELVVAHDRTGLPPALHELLAVRVEQLPPSARPIVSAAAVLGVSTDHHLLADVAELPGADVDAALTEAVRHGVLVADGATGVRFRHALLREAAHRALLPPERIRLHHRAAEALTIRSTAGGSDTEAPAIAEHRYEAGEWAAACEAYLASARAAIALHSIAAAQVQLERAIEAHARAGGRCRHDEVDEVELYRLAAHVAYLVSDMEIGFERATTALDLLGPSAPPERLAAIASLVARAAFFAGHEDQAFRIIADSEARLRAMGGDEGALAEVVCMHARLLLGRAEESVARCAEAIALARRSGARAVEGHALVTLAPSLCELGELDRAVAVGREGLAIAEEVDDADLLLRAYNNHMDVLFSAGALVEAADLMVAVMGDRSPMAAIRIGAAGFNGVEVLVTLGRWDDADRLLPLLAGKLSPGCASDTIMPALLASRRGDQARALAYLDSWWGTSPQSVTQVEALRAQIALELDDPAAAAAATDRALTALAGNDLGIELLRAHTVGLRALADEAALPVRPGRRAAGDPDKAARLAASMLAEVDAHVAGRAGPQGASTWLVALQALCHAEASRVLGPDPAAWSAAVDAWRTLGDPYEAAYCRLREAESLLASKGDRATASDALTEAWRTARELGARGLVARCDRLAERGRITLADRCGPDATPRQRAASDLGLTSREVEVLELLASGCTDGAIADELFISKKTASVHVSNILRKLDARDRRDAGRLGRDYGLGTLTPG